MVTPVHDGEEHLAECVQSVVSQSYANWEYVVHDNCSSDRTAEIVDVFARKDTRVRYLRHDEYVDVIASYNRAVRATHPESRFCKVVGADDWLYPECEHGAMPPFGPLYKQRVFVDESLGEEANIVFNGGTHADAIVMRFEDFVLLARPIIGSFAERPVLT